MNKHIEHVNALREGLTVDYCKVCDGVSNWSKVPTVLHREFTPCSCLICPSCYHNNGVIEDNMVVFDDFGICEGYKCKNCIETNISGLSESELNMFDTV